MNGSIFNEEIKMKSRNDERGNSMIIQEQKVYALEEVNRKEEK